MLDKRSWKVYPGEVLKEEFLKPMGLSVYKLARSIHVPPIRINDIVNKKRGISVDTALRLSAFFGTTPQFWLNMDNDYTMRTILEEPSEDLIAIQKFEFKEAKEKETLSKS